MTGALTGVLKSLLLGLVLLGCALGATPCSLDEVLFERGDIDAVLAAEPRNGIELTLTYFAERRFGSAERAAQYLAGAADRELPALLLVARAVAAGREIVIDRSALLEALRVVGEEIAAKYTANRYAFRELVVLGGTEDGEIADVLTNLWTGDAVLAERFFGYVMRNKIEVGAVRAELEFLAGRRHRRAFGLLGDLYFFGLGVPADSDRALDYYMAGRALDDSRSFLGLGRILQAPPYSDPSAAAEAYDAAIRLGGETEAYYAKFLLLAAERRRKEGNFPNGVDVLAGDFFDLGDLGDLARLVDKKDFYYLRNAAVGGYLPAVNTYAVVNIALQATDAAIHSLLSVSQFAPFILETGSRAHTAYRAGQYRKAALLYLYLAEFKIEAAVRNAIFIFERHDVLGNQERLLFDLYSEMTPLHPRFGHNVGDCFYYGRGIERSLPSAAAYYITSASFSSESTYNIAYMFENGEGVPQDFALAYSYLANNLTARRTYLVAFYGKIRIIIRWAVACVLRIFYRGILATVFFGAVSLVSLGYVIYKKR